ncbi:MAG: alanine--tRNA ligase [Candidatus Pacebacteria bacterium]|nr:alanine--tRNA ligase [Candidatus Paceibacterota bacterium]
MKSQEIRNRFLKFFEQRGHAIIPSASLVPENDPSVLFNTAGMQPLVPYLLGQTHPMGRRIADVQKCVRTGDLEDIGDNRHFSFFEMLGNWSLGDYFKEEAIAWSYEFLTSKEEGLGLDPKRLYITVFEGDENAPYDDESKQIWMKVGIPENRIYSLPAEDNFWSPGDNGPCGPCSEMFYDMDGIFIGQEISKEKFIEETKKETIIEIWNDVFMEYEKKDGKVIGKLAQKNVDTGAGLERMTAVMQGVRTAYETDIFKEVWNTINKLSTNQDLRAKRIVLDHIRTSVFIIDAGVVPSNSKQGYILRRLLRRAIMQSRYLGTGESIFSELVNLYVDMYKSIYPSLNDNLEIIKEVINKESEQFGKTLSNAIKKLWSEYFYNNLKTDDEKINPDVLFYFFTTEGFPPDLTLDQYNNYRKEKELPELSNQKINEIMTGFNKKMATHQKLSATASAGMFKGGLANHNEKTIRLHTAHHLLLAGLQQIVDKNIKQRGSNITEERLRIDFLCDHKLTDEEKKKVEEFVNDKIDRKLNVIRREMNREEAMNLGAEMEFGAKYPEVVSVYFIEDENGNAISKEFCGGPHVANTSELGKFKIQKEEAVASGIRRIKAVLE